MSKNQRKTLYMVLSVLVSVLFWFYVCVVEDPEGEQNIPNVPINYIGEEILNARGLSRISTQTTSLRLTFSGRKTDLYKLDNKTVSVTVDLAQITYTGESIPCVYTVVVPDSVKNSVRVVDSSSTFINLFIDHESTKNVDVRLVSNITTIDGYMVGKSALEPSEVRIKGPLSVLDKVEYAEVTLNRDNIDQSIEIPLSYKLKDADGNSIDQTNITLDTPEVLVSVPILKTKTVDLDVDFRDGGGITLLDNIIYKVEPESIIISGDPEIIDPINVLKIAQIDLSKVEASAPVDCKILLPNGCSSLSGETTAVVRIEIVGAQKRAMSITNISAENAVLPEGYMIKLVTKELTITVRGPEGVINFVNPYNVRAVVDLAGQTLKPGQAGFAPAIHVDGYNNVGAVGDYRVVLEVVPIPDE